MPGSLRRFEDGKPILMPKSYYEDGTRLAWVVESDRSGAILEDAATYVWFEVESADASRWTPVLVGSSSGTP